MFEKKIESKEQFRQEMKLLNVDELDIYEIYLPYTRYEIQQSLEGKMLVSHLRTKDSNPSFNFYLGNNGTIRFKDHGGIGGDIFIAANLVYNLSIRGYGFIQLLNHMYQDILKGMNYTVEKEQISIVPKQQVTIDIEGQDWTHDDYKYWTVGYDMELDEVYDFGIYPVDKVYLNGRYYTSRLKGKPIYAWIVTTPTGEMFWKVYLPNRTPKFLAGGIGLDFLPFTNFNSKEIGFIKARKDAICVYEFNDALVVPNSENSTRVSEVELPLFKGKKILTYLEPDQAGLHGLQILKETFGRIHSPFFPSSGVVEGLDYVNDFAEIRGYLRRSLFKEFCQWYFLIKPKSLQEIKDFIHKLKTRS